MNAAYRLPLILCLYRVTHQVVTNLPLTSKHKFRFGLACPGLARPKRNCCFDVKMSTGGSSQPDVSPCKAAANSLTLRTVERALSFFRGRKPSDKGGKFQRTDQDVVSSSRRGRSKQWSIPSCPLPENENAIPFCLSQIIQEI